MSDEAGSVTLIFYRIQNWVSEPTLNVLSAVMTASPYSHVELAIGETMNYVVRVYNDDVGVEVTSRTGRNPGLEYISLGCSKRAETAMLAFASSLKGRPFSNYAMVRSILYPRTSDNNSFFCAELVAAVLKKGGLMSSSSNPGSATPASLHALYRKQAACTGCEKLTSFMTHNTRHSRHTLLVASPELVCVCGGGIFCFLLRVQYEQEPVEAAAVLRFASPCSAREARATGFLKAARRARQRLEAAFAVKAPGRLAAACQF
jgi:hypothetical protein